MEKIEEEIEINLIDLFGRLLIKWKACLFFALLGMSCLSLVYYYKNQANTDTLAYSEEKTEEIKSQLSVRELREVEYAYQLYSTYIEDANRQRDYMDNTVLMGLSSDNATVLTRTYLINSSQADVVSVINSSIRDEEVDKRICEFFGAESNLDYVSNLVSVVNLTPSNPNIYLLDNSGNPINAEKVMAITVYGRNIGTCINIQNIIEDYIFDLEKALELNGSGFQIEKLSEYEESNAKQLIEDRNKQILSSADELRSLIKKYEDDLKASLSDKQQEYFQQLKLKDEYESKAIAFNYRSVLKYAILGFLCGAMLYAFVFVLLPYMMDGKIKTPDDLETIGIRCLQEISLSETTTAKIDIIKIIGERISYQRYKGQSEIKDVVNMVSKEVKLRLEKADITDGTVFLALDNNEDNSKRFVEAISDQLKGYGISSSYGDPENDPDLFCSLLDASGVLLVIIVDCTKRKKVFKICNLCRDNRIPILGSVSLKI